VSTAGALAITGPGRTAAGPGCQHLGILASGHELSSRALDADGISLATRQPRRVAGALRLRHVAVRAEDVADAELGNSRSVKRAR